MSNRVLVTGGAGFVGSHVCEALVANGYQIWIVDDFDDKASSVLKRRNITELTGLSSVRLVEGHVSDNVLLSGLLSDISFSAVVHLACHSRLTRQVEDPESCEASIRGTLRLLEAMKRHSVYRLVLASSTSVYGDGTVTPFTEGEADGRPKALDGAGNRASELLAHTYHATRGFAVHCLRLSAVYGPRQRPDQAPHRYATLLDEHGTVPGNGELSRRRDYIHVRDVAEAVRRSLSVLCEQETNDYEIFNISGPDCLRESLFVSRLAEALDMESNVDPGQKAEKNGDARSVCSSGDKARSLLGFEPQIGLEEGLAQFAKWYRNGDTESPNRSSVDGVLPVDGRNGAPGTQEPGSFSSGSESG